MPTITIPFASTRVPGVRYPMAIRTATVRIGWDGDHVDWEMPGGLAEYVRLGAPDKVPVCEINRLIMPTPVWDHWQEVFLPVHRRHPRCRLYLQDADTAERLALVGPIVSAIGMATSIEDMMILTTDIMVLFKKAVKV